MPKSTMEVLIDKSIGCAPQKIPISAKALWRTKEEKTLTIFLINMLLFFLLHCKHAFYDYKLEMKKK